jgi:hypothetical protein
MMCPREVIREILLQNLLATYHLVNQLALFDGKRQIIAVHNDARQGQAATVARFCGLRIL